MMSRRIAIAVAAFVLAAPAFAAPQQLVAPNFNPGLRTVPFVPHTYYAARPADACEQKLVDRIEAGNAIVGDSAVQPAGAAESAVGGEAKSVIASTSAGGLAATADYVTCKSANAAPAAQENVRPSAAD